MVLWVVTGGVIPNIEWGYQVSETFQVSKIKKVFWKMVDLGILIPTGEVENGRIVYALVAEDQWTDEAKQYMGLK